MTSTANTLPPKPDSDSVDAAQQLWLSCKPAAGSLVSVYFECFGVTIDPPPAIRYHAALRHAATGLHLPALVARVDNRSGLLIGVHCIFLRMDGRGRAGTSTTEITLGKCAGGGIYLGQPAPTMALAVGVEAGLAMMGATSLPTVAVLSADGLKSLELPALVREVAISGNGDEGLIDGVRIVARRFEQEGRRVRITTTAGGAAVHAEV